MSKFFKSAWFKCTLVLLVIAVVSGSLISILSNVLYVSDEERTARAIKKIYGQEKEFNILMRDCSGKEGFDGKQYMRIAVRDTNDNDKLIVALKKLEE